MLLFSSWLDLGAVVVWRLSHCFALSSVCSVLVGSVLVRLGKLDGWRWPEMAGEVHGADMVHDDVVVAWTSWHTLTYQSSLMSPVFALRWSQYLLTSVFHIGIVIKSFSVFSFIVLNVWQTESSLFFCEERRQFPYCCLKLQEVSRTPTAIQYHPYWRQKGESCEPVPWWTTRVSLRSSFWDLLTVGKTKEGWYSALYMCCITLYCVVFYSAAWHDGYCVVAASCCIVFYQFIVLNCVTLYCVACWVLYWSASYCTV